MYLFAINLAFFIPSEAGIEIAYLVFNKFLAVSLSI